MTKYHQIIPKNVGLLGTILGGFLIGLPAMTPAASAVPFSTLQRVNPCPGIYYEEPFYSTRLVPEGCPANAATQQTSREFTAARTLPVAPTPPSPQPGVVQPPLPEQRSNAIATVTPREGRVNVRVNNDTNARISYEVIGHTQTRTLAGGEEIVLRNLPTPVTLTMVRQDDGFIQVVPISTDETGILEISLRENPIFDENQGVLRIEQQGQVFLN